SVKRWSSVSSAKWALLERRWISPTCSLVERLLRAAQVQRSSLKRHQVNFTACVWQSEMLCQPRAQVRLHRWRQLQHHLDKAQGLKNVKRAPSIHNNMRTLGT